jgi:hypothetical protein
LNLLHTLNVECNFMGVINYKTRKDDFTIAIHLDEQRDAVLDNRWR